jgi:hypothetical protein
MRPEKIVSYVPHTVGIIHHFVNKQFTYMYILKLFTKLYIYI